MSPLRGYLPKIENNVCWFSLDEKSILYGRTGVRQEGDGGSVNLKPEIVALRDSRSNSQEGCSGGTNTLQVDPSGKALSALTKIQGEALRCLSPAEEVQIISNFLDI